MSDNKKIVGYVGQNVYFSENQETNKAVISFTVKPQKADSEWVRVRAFNETAKYLNNAIKNEGIKKLTLQGNYKEISFKTKNGEEKTVNELFVNTVALNKPIEIHGIIAKAETLPTATGKNYDKLFIINDNDIGGSIEKAKYNVIIFEEAKKKLPDNVQLEVSKPIAIKGEASITRFRNKDNKIETATQIVAWNVARTPTLLKEQIADLQVAGGKQNTPMPAPTSLPAPKPVSLPKLPSPKLPKKATSKGQGTDFGLNR